MFRRRGLSALFVDGSQVARRPGLLQSTKTPDAATLDQRERVAI
jgi:hypothetical protein